MDDRPFARVLAELGAELRPLLEFVTRSRYSERMGDPAICDFVFGNPHEMPLQGITDALQRWAEPENKDWFAYKNNEEPARAAVAASLRQALDLPFEPDDVFLTPGTFGALSVALRTVCDPGDEVIYLSPPWFFYGPMIRVAGAVPVRVDVAPPAFDLDPATIAAAITPRTRAIIVNSPNNPGGRVYSREDLEGVARVLADASERNGRAIYLLSDESYRRILFDDRTFTSPAAVYPNTIVMYTYGKTLLAPGERVGYLALAPSMPSREALRDPVFLAQIVGGWQFPNATLQYAIPELEELSVDVGALQRRRDRLVGSLREFGYDVIEPEGTFYIPVRSPVSNDYEFVELLGARDVFVLAGAIFELPGWFRLSVTANDDMVERSLPHFEAALKEASA